MLNWAQLRRASEAKSLAVIAKARAMGGELAAAIEGARGDAQEAAPDPFEQYDPVTLLECGVANWSYGAPVNPDTVASLDETTAAWASRAVFELSRPAQGEQLKNS